MRPCTPLARQSTPPLTRVCGVPQRPGQRERACCTSTRLIHVRLASALHARSHSCVQVGLWRPQRADPGHRGGLSESRHTSISCRWALSPSAPFPMLSCLLRRCGRIQVCQGVPNGFWQQPGAPTYPPHSTSPALKARMTFSCSVSGAGRFGSMSQPDLQGGAGKALVVKASYT